jgi:hypothetical protein
MFLLAEAVRQLLWRLGLVSCSACQILELSLCQLPGLSRHVQQFNLAIIVLNTMPALQG